jgi:Flp pilus assembly protein TadD
VVRDGRDLDAMNDDRRHARRNWIVALVFILLALVAFGPALDAPFDFDDGPAIVENSSSRSLSSAIWPGAQQGSPVAGRPVVNVSFAVNAAMNRSLGVEDPRRQTIVFHATNLVLHVVVALLIVAVVYRTLSNFGLAAIVAGLWLVLPIQTEAVNYVTQRSEILVSLFYVLTLYASIRSWEPSRRTRWIVLAVTSSALGMLSKEVMITAPIIVLLYDRAFRAQSWRSIWGDGARRVLYASLFATTLIVIVGAFARARGHSVGFDGPVTPWRYFWTQAWAIPHYVRLAFWPSGLAFDYGVKPIATSANIVGFVMLAVAGAATLVALSKPAWRWLGFLGAWFFLILAPSSSIVPIQTEIAAERRVYLAIGAVVVLVVIAGDRILRGRVRGASLVAAAGIVAIVVSARRSVQYRDLVVRWTDAVAATPNNGRAYDNLASALLRLEPPNIAAADSVLQRAIVVDPTFAPAWFRKATIALAERRTAATESLLVRAVALDPHHADARHRLEQLAVMQIERGRGGEAVRGLEQLARNDARSGITLGLLSLAYAQDRRDSLAARVADSAVANAHDNPAVFVLAGRALFTVGELGDAAEYTRQAVRLRPNDVEGLARLAIIEATLGNRPMAMQLAQRAVALAPSDSLAREALTTASAPGSRN